MLNIYIHDYIYIFRDIEHMDAEEDGSSFGVPKENEGAGAT
jgi:hypothetical protein